MLKFAYAKKIILALILVSIIFCAYARPIEAKQTNWQIVKQLCKGKTIKLVKSNELTDKQFWKLIDNRKGKKYIIVEKVVSISDGTGYGWYSTRTKETNYIIGYNKKVPKGKKVISYVIWNPKSNECDDILYVVDNNKYR